MQDIELQISDSRTIWGFKIVIWILNFFYLFILNIK